MVVLSFLAFGRIIFVAGRLLEGVKLSLEEISYQRRVVVGERCLVAIVQWFADDSAHAKEIDQDRSRLWIIIQRAIDRFNEKGAALAELAASVPFANCDLSVQLRLQDRYQVAPPLRPAPGISRYAGFELAVCGRPAVADCRGLHGFGLAFRVRPRLTLGGLLGHGRSFFARRCATRLLRAGRSDLVE